MQNAFVESLNGRFRDECLNEHVFQGLLADGTPDHRGLADRLQCLPTSYQSRRVHSERVCNPISTGPQPQRILVISEGINGAGSIPVVPSKENSIYDSEFEAIFKQAGWKFLHFVGGAPRPKPYAKIRVGWRETKTASYLAVTSGLNAAHIEFEEGEFEVSGKEGEDIVVLDVGVIPMTDYQIAIDRAE